MSSSHDVNRYIRCTLLAATQDFQDVVAASTKAALKWLCAEGFIRWGATTKERALRAMAACTCIDQVINCCVSLARCPQLHAWPAWRAMG